MPTGEGKTKRIVVASTVAGVLLLTFFLVVIIIQLVQIGVKQGEVERLNGEITRLEQQIQDGEKNYEYYSSVEGLENLARQWGYKLPTDK